MTAARRNSRSASWAIVNRSQDEGAQQWPVHRSDGAEKASATDNGRCYCLQFPPFRLSRVPNTDTRGQ
jgi:hypothetical protein